MTGVDDEKAVGRLFWDLVIPPDHVDGFGETFLSAVARGDEVWHETPWLAAGGDELTVEKPIVSLAGYRPDHYMIFGTDVTNRKPQEAQGTQARAARRCRGGRTTTARAQPTRWSAATTRLDLADATAHSVQAR
jgi:hypothetical protein